MILLVSEKTHSWLLFNNIARMDMGLELHLMQSENVRLIWVLPCNLHWQLMVPHDLIHKDLVEDKRLNWMLAEWLEGP